MVFPIPLILALGLSGAGIGANMIGARQADKAQAAVMAANRTRQSALDDKAFAVNKGAQDRFRGFEEQQAAREADLAELLTQRPEGEEPEIASPPTSSNITLQRTGVEKAKAKEYTDQQGQAKARLMSLGDLFGDIDTAFARDAVDVSQIDRFKRGWLDVLPVELDAAAQKGQGWRLLGDILGGAGSVATMGALTGATLPGSLAGLFGRGAVGAPRVGTNMLASLY